MRLGLAGLSKALDAGLLGTVAALLRARRFNRVANLVAASEPIATFAPLAARDAGRGGGGSLSPRATPSG